MRLGDMEISGSALRMGLGPERMRSNLLDRFEVKDGELHMAGRGYGHGVGMSQYGVYGLSLLGKTYTEIIEHFYPGTELHNLY